VGWLDEGDVADAYHVEVGFHKQVIVALESPEGANYDLDLHGRYRELEESSTNPGGEADTVEWLSPGGVLGEESDYIYLNVRRVSGEANTASPPCCMWLY
jgi:hypothetical protein